MIADQKEKEAKQESLIESQQRNWKTLKFRSKKKTS